MNNLEADILVLESNKDPIIESNCIKNWIGRIVAFCPEGRYTNETSLKVQLALGITGILSVGTLAIGAVWKDYLSNSEKVILATLGGIGVVSCVSGFVINGIILYFQPS